MAGDANITDVGALDEFRRALIRFREELNAALAEADSEVKSTFVWLERDRMLHWRRAVPKLDEELTSAKSALFRKEAQTMGSGQRPSTIDEKKEVERVKRRCEDARERLERTRRWLATLERDVSLFKSAMSPVSSMVDRDLPDAILRLRNMALALEAYLATPSVSLGRNVGSKRALDMLFTGQPIDAATALRDGLVSRVVPPADLDRGTMAFAQHIAAQPPQQIAEGKAMFHKHMTMELDQAYAYATEFMAGAIQREDAQAGIDAFVSKKPKPDWTGR